jgi:excisionase family DNA binding protein
MSNDSDKTNEQEFLRVAEVAKIIGVSERTVQRWVEDKVIKSSKLGGVRLIPKKEIDRLQE